jgi:dihydrofolate synthase/folylpolyglutamate synthase
MLASILGAAGVRCGLYTKPHLQSFRERIRIDGRAITPCAFGSGVERMQRYAAALPKDAGEPTTFEVTTALAVEEFAREDCEMAVVEVGLGGRLDATNALEPFVSVIASISYDHTAILGRTLGAIATEKAGIMRRGRCAILAQQRPAAMRALRRVCREVGADCQVVAPLPRELPLAGAHQRQNAALAVAAARVMTAVSDETVERGLERLQRWPGRFEIIDGDPPIILDGAHNGASAEALAETLEAYAVGRPIQLVVGINRDKDARAVLRPLLRIADSVWATQTSANPRALAAAELGLLCRRLGVDARVEPDAAAALAAAASAATRPGRGVARAGDIGRVGGVVCVTGSLMLVGQARATLGLAVPEELW